jgi:hypothetical protein
MEAPNDAAMGYARSRLRDFGEVDDDVVRVIVNAARYQPDDTADPQISTSRVFLGALDAGDGGGAFAALARAVHEIANGEAAVRDLRSMFRHGPTEEAMSRIEAGLSPNSGALLQTAMSYGSGRLTSYGLARAMLQPARGRVWSRMREDGVDFEQLRRRFEELFAHSPKPNAGPSIASFISDNPWSGRLTDSIGVEAEAAAFARLALSTEVNPPLAVGVFGDWGTGKTYFMRRVFETVKDMTESANASTNTGTSFHADVVQIRFNAWHYVETNLWASIVDHIFTELDRWIVSRTAREDANSLLSRLDTARRLTIGAAQSLVHRRQEQRDAEKKLHTAETELADARARAEVKPRDVVESFHAVFAQEIGALKADVANQPALKQTGLDALDASAEAFRARLNSLTDEGRRGSVVLAQLVRLLGSGWWLAFVIVAIVVAPTLLVLGKQQLLSLPFGTWLRDVPDLVVAVSGLLAGLTVAGGRMLGAISPVLDRLTSLRSHLDAKLDAKLATQEAARQAAAADAVAKAAEVDRARRDLDAARTALATALENYAAETGFRRLQRFIQTRATDGTYAKHLGLVATVRRDFEQLSNLMLGQELDPHLAKAREAYEKDVNELIASAGDLLEDPEVDELRDSAKPVTTHKAADQVRLGRIILYIDDLDRCPPAKVVDVLQAVHMLLTFQLFVVFVAVDARWVTRALITHYPDLLVSDATSAKPGERGANPHDYLEKIFQIPYWVRPLTSEASRKYLSDLLQASAPATRPSGMEDSRQAPLVPSAGGPPRMPFGASPPRGQATTGAPGSGDGPQGGHHFGRAEILKLSEQELAFMQTLAPYAGSSPRRLLRFVNVYRVITSAMDETARERLVSDATYLSLLTQLAIVTGASDVLHDWLAISDEDIRENCSSIAELLTWLDTDARFDIRSSTAPRGWRSIRGAVQEYSNATHASDSLVQLRDRWPAVARRYSFLG